MKISRNLAVCLYNCDPSGLSDESLAIYNGVDFNFNVIDWAEESSDINGICELSRLHDHCVTIEVIE